MFDGTLGNYNGTEYRIELQKGAQLNHDKPFPSLKIYEETLKTEVNRLVNMDVLKCKNDSEWAVPTFKIPKKNASVCFISVLGELNKRIKRKPFPLQKLQGLL